MPSVVGISFDPESVVDLRMVALAQERRVLQAGLSAIAPMQDVMDLAPPGGRLAAGEDAGLVAELDRAPQVRRDDTLSAAHLHGHRVRTDDDAGDGAVAGQHPYPCGGDRRSQSGRARTRTWTRVDQVVDAYQDAD